MVVDCILDRKDGSPYNPREFYQDMLAYEADDISRAMDEGTEEDVKKALCDYIKFNDYNPAICDYINSVNWLTSSKRKYMKKSIKSAHPFAKPYEDLETGKHQCKMWRGVPGVEMIWHGEYSDPELEYEGTRRNYWDVEGTMYEWAKEDGIDIENDEEFNRYCQEHAYDVYECFSSCRKKNGKKSVKSSRKPIQSMYVTQDISGNDLYTCLWSGGKDQFDSMIEDGADADDILNACEELLFREEGNPPTMTELNDLIWFDPDTIRDYIGLTNPIESGCHGKSKKGKGKKKVVKSGRKAIKSNLSYDIVDNFDFEVIQFDQVQEEYLGLNFEVGEIIDLNALEQMAEPINGYAEAEVDYNGGDACIKITFYGMNPEFDGERNVSDYIIDCQIWVKPYATDGAIDRIVNELNGNFN